MVLAESGGSGTLGRLNAWLAGQGLRAGDRLPAERRLCAALGVSRSELRKALAVLEMQGALSRLAGVHRVAVDLQSGNVEVEHEPDVALPQLREAVDAAGFEVVG